MYKTILLTGISTLRDNQYMSVIKGMTPGLIELDPATLKADEAGNQVPTEIEVLQAGSWNTPNHGSFSVKPEDLDQYVQNFNDGVRKGVPIDLEHNTSGGAVGWIESLRRAGDSLFASVKWTKAGADLISSRTYRFFSPEFSPAGYKDPEGKAAADKNILIGGALTNRPLFKNLQAISANDKSTTGSAGDSGVYIIYAEEGDKPMQLEEIRKLDPSKLTDEQKTFVEQHKAELSDEERTKFSLVVAAPVAKVEDNANKDAAASGAAVPVAASDKVGKEAGMVTISASQLSALEESAKLGRMAHAELEHKKASDLIGGFTFNDNKFKPAAQEAITKFYLGLTEDQRTVFASDVVANIQTVGIIKAGDGGNGGDGSEVVAGSAAEELNSAAEKIMADDKVGYSVALIKAKDSNPELAKRYQSELKSTNGEV